MRVCDESITDTCGDVLLQEDKIQEQQKREEDNEERRSQARRTLKEQQEANRIEQEKLNHQKQEARTWPWPPVCVVCVVCGVCVCV
jgi:Flp pilus assembly protein TadB